MTIEMPVNPRQWLLSALGRGHAPVVESVEHDDDPTVKGSNVEMRRSDTTNFAGPSNGGLNPNVLFAKEAFKIDPSTGEKIEADTDDSEEIDLAGLILPSDLPSSHLGYGVYVNRCLLDGWVKQVRGGGEKRRAEGLG